MLTFYNRKNKQYYTRTLYSQNLQLTIMCSSVFIPATKLQEKLEKTLQHLSFTQGVSEDLRSKVKTMKNVQHRAAADKTQAEEQKVKKVKAQA